MFRIAIRALIEEATEMDNNELQIERVTRRRLRDTSNPLELPSET